MSDSYLLLWFEGPLQSWGHDSKFGRRDTLDFPTKSGVLGLVCCAMGAGGKQRELLGKFANLDMIVIAYSRAKQSSGGKFQKQAREPLLRDFHMVGSGFDDQNPWEKLLIPKTSEGKKAVGGGAKMTYRYYLQDMAFAIALQVPDDMVQTISSALECPVWDVYLGRKSCVPTDFILREKNISKDNALEMAGKLAKDKALIEDFRVLNGEHEGDVITLNDVPIQFGENKQYCDRRVTIINT